MAPCLRRETGKESANHVSMGGCSGTVFTGALEGPVQVGAGECGEQRLHCLTWFRGSKRLGEGDSKAGPSNSVVTNYRCS